MEKVLVAMSGGVDSSVAAFLLKEAGYDVVGVTMRLWTLEQPDLPVSRQRCCSVEDTDDARRVCQILYIPHYILNLEREFKEYVVDYFCREYMRGRTPNPCLACNEKVKFDFLLKKALSLGMDFIATGHYARIHGINGTRRLLKAIDPLKDQSYVLFSLKQEELKRTLFPLGCYSKAEARQIAEKAGLPVARKPDSQEICFIPGGNYRTFIAERSAPRPGEIVDSSGRVLGKHPGVEFFTVGQRHGLGLNLGSPMYVLKVDANRNQVVAGTEEKLYSKELLAERVSYVSGVEPEAPVEITAKIRRQAPETEATLIPMGDCARLFFHRPQKAVTAGQAVAFYTGEEVLGGGIIAAAS